MKNKKSKSNRRKEKNVPQRQPQETVSAQKNAAVTSAKSLPKEKSTSPPQTGFVFGKKNYKFMFIGLAVIALGFILMAGGGSDDPNVFNEEIFSTRRIHIAPMVVILGFAIEVYAILLNPNSDA